MPLHSGLSRFGIRVASIVAGMTLWVPIAMAEVSLPKLFGPGMVLQQGHPLPVWGRASPGERVVVELAGQRQETTADGKGYWRVTLTPLDAAAHPEPLTMTVDGLNTLTIDRIRVGEVWLMAGGERVAKQVRMLANAQAILGETSDAPVMLFEAKKDASWQSTQSGHIGTCPAEAYLFARNLQKKLNVPLGVIIAAQAYPETPLETWISRTAIEAALAAKPILDFYASAAEKTGDESYEQQLEAWRKANQALPLNPPPPPERTATTMANPITPTAVHDRVFPLLAPFAVRGLIWDHGENDSSLVRARQYGHLLPSLLQTFRDAWGNPKLPVVIVQLRAVRFGKFDDRCGAELRESQDTVGQSPATGLVVTLDLGPNPDERLIARRVADVARAVAYGESDIPHSGPTLMSAETRGSEVVLTFENADGLRSLDGPLRGFALASSIYRWAWADTRIEGKTVIVSAPGIEKPEGVRYCYQDLPDQRGNLVNAAGWPAAPFRTDSHRAYTEEVTRPDQMPRYSVRAALTIEDPRLPRVLIIGDSISGGYQEPLRKRLVGRANLIGESQLQNASLSSCGPACYTTTGALRNDNLRNHLTTREPYDVIHFNMGIHEFAGAAPGAAASYADRLRQVIGVMREAAPQAKLIWCSSTGTISDNLIPRFPNYLSNCQAFNAAAAEVMQEEDIPINDLYSLLQPRIREVITGDHIHFQEAAKEEMADFLAPAILEALPKR
jgi:sialate O-acetylesterase